MSNKHKPPNGGLDDIYGMKLGEYAKRHKTTVASMISKTELDIKILRENLEVEKLRGYDTPTFKTIYNVYIRKKEHLDRLKEWRNNEEVNTFIWWDMCREIYTGIENRGKIWREKIRTAYDKNT